MGWTLPGTYLSTSSALDETIGHSDGEHFLGAVEVSLISNLVLRPILTRLSIFAVGLNEFGELYHGLN